MRRISRLDSQNFYLNMSALLSFAYTAVIIYCAYENAREQKLLTGTLFSAAVGGCLGMLQAIHDKTNMPVTPKKLQIPFAKGSVIGGICGLIAINLATDMLAQLFLLQLSVGFAVSFTRELIDQHSSFKIKSR